MIKVKLGKKALKNFAYTVEDIGSRKVEKHGSKVGLKSLAKSKALAKAKK